MVAYVQRLHFLMELAEVHKPLGVHQKSAFEAAVKKEWIRLGGCMCVLDPHWGLQAQLSNTKLAEYHLQTEVLNWLLSTVERDKQGRIAS